MQSHLRLSLTLFALLPACFCSAQDLNGLFTAPKHNFGTVARGAKTEHIFTFTNTTARNIRINSVRASCGCTTPSIVTQSVRPGEVGAIRAQFNTLSFLGQRGATITVQFIEPYFAEVQLRVDGFVRRDIVFTPGEVSWGTVNEGSAKEQVVNIAYAGRSDWKITKATCANPNIKIDLTETRRQGQLVNYQMKVKLTGTAPAGSIYHPIVFETDDNRLRTVPLSMNGQVQSAVSISPAVLYLSDSEQGQVINKTLFVRGNEDFQLTTFESNDPSVKGIVSDKKAKFHRVPITIDTTGKSGEFTSEIVIGTDMNGLTRTVKVVGKVQN